MFVSTVDYTAPDVTEQAEEFEGPFKPAKTLKQGSVLDLLKSPGKIDSLFLVFFLLHFHFFFQVTVRFPMTIQLLCVVV